MNFFKALFGGKEEKPEDKKKAEEERKKAYRELKDKENNDLTKDNGI